MTALEGNSETDTRRDILVKEDKQEHHHCSPFSLDEAGWMDWWMDKRISGEQMANVKSFCACTRTWHGYNGKRIAQKVIQPFKGQPPAGHLLTSRWGPCTRAFPIRAVTDVSSTWVDDLN